MTLTWGVVALVLVGALLHASWNAMVKSSTDKALDTALIHLLGSVITLPMVAVLGWPPAEAWPYMAASVVIHNRHRRRRHRRLLHRLPPGQAGRTDVLLLEQGKLTSGTTWHAAGLVGQMRPNRT
jgi:hypothetical protein